MPMIDRSQEIEVALRELIHQAKQHIWTHTEIPHSGGDAWSVHKYDRDRFWEQIREAEEILKGYEVRPRATAKAGEAPHSQGAARS